jgi:hypothetical protein
MVSPVREIDDGRGMTDDTGAVRATTTRAAVRLNELDLDFLRVETHAEPMQWSMVFELDGDGQSPIGIAELKERVRERAHGYDLFSTRIAPRSWRAPRVLQAQSWNPATQVHALDSTDHDTTQQQIARLMANHLSFDHPPWEVTLLTQANPAKQFIVLRVHHCLSDGVAGAGFAALLADSDHAGLSDLERFITSERFQLRLPPRKVLRTARLAFVSQWWAGRGSSGWPRLTESGRRDVGLHSEPTRVVRVNARSVNASTHEYLVATIGSAISIAPPDAFVPRRIRVAFPVTFDLARRHTGNAWDMALVNLPGAEAELRAQLDNSQNELAEVQRAHPEYFLPSISGSAKVLPWSLQRAMAHLTWSVIRPAIHIGVVPGLMHPRSVLARKVTAVFGLSPLAVNSLSVTIVVLGDTTTFGIIADPDALPGYARRLAEAIGQVIRESPASLVNADRMQLFPKNTSRR